MSENKKLPKITFMGLLLVISGIIWVLVLFGGLQKVSEKNTISREEIAIAIERDTAALPVLKQSTGKPRKGIDVLLVSKPTEKMLELGKEKYNDICASCHGMTGIGDGEGGTILDPKPRNFTDPKGWTNGRLISQMYKTLEEGVPGTGMTAYEYLDPSDRIAMIHYIRTFANDYPVDTDEQLLALDGVYGLSEDRLAGAQIPLKKAIENVRWDYNKVQRKVDLAVGKIGRYNTWKESNADKYIVSTEKVCTMFAKDDVWKENIDHFKEIVFSSVNDNGFKASVLRASQEEILWMHQAFRDIF